LHGNRRKGIFANHTRSFLKNILLVTIRIIISAIILFYIISLVKWDKVLEAYRNADGSYIFFGAILLLVNLGCRTIKWQIMLRSVKKEPSLLEAFGSLC